jgi:hypothetical protein
VAPDPQPAWLRALSRLESLLDTVHAATLCSAVEKIEKDISNVASHALDFSKWEELARLADELVELRRFKELVCR